MSKGDLGCRPHRDTLPSTRTHFLIVPPPLGPFAFKSPYYKPCLRTQGPPLWEAFSMHLFWVPKGIPYHILSGEGNRDGVTESSWNLRSSFQELLRAGHTVYCRSLGFLGEGKSDGDNIWSRRHLLLKGMTLRRVTGILQSTVQRLFTEKSPGG